MVDETKIDGIPVYEIYKNRSLQDMTGEEWRSIEGYEGLYMASSVGRVKSLNYNHTGKENILKQCKDKDDYLIVNLWKYEKQKSHRVQRLVANAFIPNPENKPQVNHISEPLYDDENKYLAKKDNRVVNLEWCDSKYNVNYGTGRKRSAEKHSKKVLCVETNKVYPSSMEAERQTGIANASIIKCCKGKLKSSGKLHWQYA